MNAKEIHEGFDAVKQYVDGITDQVEERLIALEKKAPAELSRSEVEEQDRTPYPVHLTPAERQAVREKAERAFEANWLKILGANKTVGAGVFASTLATLVVQLGWIQDRVETLEATAQGTAKTAKPGVRVQARKDTK